MYNSYYLQGGISMSYQALSARGCKASTTIVMKKIKQKRRNEKRKDSIKKILGI